MLYNYKSNRWILFFTGRLEDVVFPANLNVNLLNETITVSQRNWYGVGENSKTVAFRFIKTIDINEFFIGATIHIKVSGEHLTIAGLKKANVKAIKQLLINYNQGKGKYFFI